MAHTKEHDYHIIEPSVWPFLGAVGGFIMLLGAVLFFHDYGPWIMMMGMVLVAYVMIAWWGDVIKEAQTGDHTPTVRIGLRYGFILFVMSEIMFFAAWFWNFFKHALYPMEEGSGSVWPPVGIETFDPWHLPLINTLILLLSGAAATWAHHAIAHENNRKDLIQGLFWAIILGVAFTGFQIYEYSHAAFSFSGNIYGATFFMATGFHGAHVIIGTAFLLVCLFRAMKGHFTPEAHIGFETAAWYWHFVDVVWLFLFVAVYIWGA
ncbi:MAG: cytochrome c oxidase subunit 3 [Rhodobacteraceae bacterium]|nr:cytochrome c oxidase subunit 3 [Paracoccaceae bacterium]MCY4249343.1 cytochrome c oxidase subunit 3 [Paracoccaceae bacterium]MCY4308080.1 cytochrome c oxidase subunit 3 [Paracoccaceae bacterium]